MELDTVSRKNWVLFQYFKQSKGCYFTLEDLQDQKFGNYYNFLGTLKKNQEKQIF